MSTSDGKTCVPIGPLDPASDKQAHFAPSAAPNEPSSRAESNKDTDGQRAEPQQPQGVAEAAPEVVAPGLRKRAGGKPGRSGPPGNSNAASTGTFVVRREHKALKKMAMDPATPEGQFAAEVRRGLREHVGDGASTTQGYTIDLLSRLLVVEAYFSAFFADHPPINRKRRAAHPIVRDYLSLVGAIRNLLGDLGLERRAKDVTDLQTYLATAEQRRAAPAGSGAAAGTIPADAPAAETDEATD